MKSSDKRNRPTQKLITVVLAGLLGTVIHTAPLLEGIAVAQNKPTTLVPPLPSAPSQLTMGMRTLSAKAPAAVLQTLAEGKSQDVIVVFDDHEVRRQAAILEKGKDQHVLDFQAEQFTSMKRAIKAALPVGEVSVRRDYRHLPMMALRVHTSTALNTLLKRGEVAKIYRNEKRYLSLAESLPLIHQPNIPNAENAGNGTTVAVLDTGVDYTNPAFGPCSEPGVPAECKIIVAQDIAPDDGSLDDDGHGTNVAGIVLGVAPGARVAALDVFRQGPEGLAAFDSDILAAIDWAIANQATYNIVAMNLSLGGGLSSAICEDSAYTTPFAQARAAGITPVVAAGNDGDPFQISYPACTPGAIRVGA